MAGLSQERPEGPVGRLLARVGDGLAAVSTLLIALLMLLIAADAAARNLMGASLPLVSEFGAALLVAIVHLALAATVRANRLARTDMVLTALAASHPRLAAGLSAFYDLAGAVMLGMIGRAGLLARQRDIAGEKSSGIQGVLTFPVWPFGLAFVPGLAVAAAQFAWHAWRAAFGAGARLGGRSE
jgi:TRAP-type C4-dicarboxylate transport system permease small subunit